MSRPHSLTAVIVSRFLLNLQAVNQQAVGSECSDLSYDTGSGGAGGSASTLIFKRVVGSLASVPVSLWEPEASSLDSDLRFGSESTEGDGTQQVEHVRRGESAANQVEAGLS